MLQSKKTHKADDQTNTTNLVISLPCSLARSLAPSYCSKAPKAPQLQNSSSKQPEASNFILFFPVSPNSRP
jgi:hypothetical protein